MSFLNYLVLSLKSWLKTPVVFALAVLMLAVGIGASVAAYGFLHAALLQPLPVKNPHEIMRISCSLFSSGTMPPGHYYDVAEHSPVLSDSFMARLHQGTNFQFEEKAILVNASEVSGNYFQALEMNAKAGRLIERDDDVPGGDLAVVVSERLWRNEFESREDLIGASILLNGKPATVIGIVSKPFRGTFRMNDADVWFPHKPLLKEAELPQRGYYVYTAMFRLREGVNAAQVQGELDAVAAVVEREPGTRSGYSLRLQPEREAVLERYQDLARQSFFILGVLLTLLLIACANVSNILLAKVNSRRSELAVRRALGAPVRSIFSLLLADGIVLAGLAGLAGIGFSFLFLQGFSLLGMEIASGDALNIRVLLFFLAVVLGAGLMCSIVPAIQAVRVNINEVLKESSRTSTRFRTGGALIVIQVAFSLTLLIGGGLFIRSLQEAQRVELGLRTEKVLSFSLNLEHLGGFEKKEIAAFYNQIIQELEEVPGIVSAGISNYRLIQGHLGSVAGVWMSGVDFPEDSDLWRSNYFILGPGFFETMDIPIVSGRSPTIEDLLDDPLIAVINETFANHFWPGEDPVGREFNPVGTDRSWKLRVIGVSRDFRPGVREPPPPIFMYGDAVGRFIVAVHTRVNPESLKPRILSIMRDIDSSLPVQDLRTIEESLGLAIQPIRAGFTIMLTVGFLGLGISVVGIFAALSYWVRRSAQEIGLRMALGASPVAMVTMYVQRGALIVLGGLLLGLGLAAFSMPFARDLFYEVSPWDPVTFVVVPVILFLAALLATYFSARHAARVDPMVALRRD